MKNYKTAGELLEHYKSMGKKGGQSTLAKYGREHFVAMRGKKGKGIDK